MGLNPHIYLKVRLLVSFLNSNFNQCSHFFELTTELNYTSKHHFNNHGLYEPEKTPDVPLSPIARKQPDSNAFPVTPSPMKDCGSKRPFVDNEPSSNARKTSRTTPPTKVTDDPFIDDEKKPPSKSVPIGDKILHEQTLIPVTTNMINSAVSENNQFVLKDGRPLHLVKVMGAIVH